MTVTVIVVSHRPGDWLPACLASVTAQADQVLLVDNGSEGAGASAAGAHAGVQVLRCDRNTGFAPAVNMAAGNARCDLLALLNDDATASPGWLVSAATFLERPGVAAVGPKVVLRQKYREVLLDDGPWWAEGDSRPLGRQLRSVVTGGKDVLARLEGPGVYRLERGPDGPTWRWTSGGAPWYFPLEEGNDGSDLRVNGEEVPPGRVVTLINSKGSYLDHRGYAGDVGSGTADDGGNDFPTERFALSGVALVTRRSTWERLGPFASPFFAYYEDVDWCWRARLGGMSLYYDPGSTVAHRRSASSGGEHVPAVRVMAERNRTLCLVRNGPRRLVGKALLQRARNGPDGGVRSGIARLLPWAARSRAALSRRWELSPEEVWAGWAGADVDRVEA